MLVQLAPAPTHLVFAVLLASLALTVSIAALVPETSGRRPGALASLRPRVGVPFPLRPQVLSLVPTMVAGWALAGLYLSLGPSVAVSVFALRSHVIGGLLVMLLSGTGAATSYVLRAHSLQGVLRVAGILLAAGTAVTLAGVESQLAVLAAAGTVLAGVGLGASVLGSFGTVSRIAPPEQRGELLAAAYVISYLAFSVPAVLAGGGQRVPWPQARSGRLQRRGHRPRAGSARRTARVGSAPDADPTLMAITGQSGRPWRIHAPLPNRR